MPVLRNSDLMGNSADASFQMVSEGTVTQFLICKYGTDKTGAGTQATLATADTAPLVGASQGATVGTGLPVYFPLPGQCGKVTLGGSVNAGDPLTCDGSSKAIVAAPAGAGYIFGIAGKGGVANDVITYIAQSGYIT